MRLTMAGAGFSAEGQLSILSEVIVPGDIQVTGDGTPFVLLPECQTTGGYPRIGTVIPADLPRAAQAGPGARLRFRFVGLEEALAAERQHRAVVRSLSQRVRPAIRDSSLRSDSSSSPLGIFSPPLGRIASGIWRSRSSIDDAPTALSISSRCDSVTCT